MSGAGDGYLYLDRDKDSWREILDTLLGIGFTVEIIPTKIDTRKLRASATKMAFHYYMKESEVDNGNREE